MSLSNALKKSLFAKIDNIVCDLQTGTLAVKVRIDDNDSIVSFVHVQKEGCDEVRWSLEQNPLAEFSIPVPGFAVRTPVCQLKPGDIVVLADDTTGFFVEKVCDEKLTNPVIKVVSAKTGRVNEVNISTNKLLGSHGVLAVKNFFGNCHDKSINSLLPMLLMGEGKQDDFLMMMMLSGDNKNMMLPLLMSKMGGDKGSSKDLLMMMMLNNGGGMDMSAMLPFMSGMFGQCGEAKEKSEVKPVIKKVPVPSHNAY